MRSWNEHDHPRDDHGRFGHGHGGDHPNTGSHAGGGERGMPDAVATNTVKLSSGESITIDRHDDGGVTLTSGNDQVTYSPAETNRVMGDLASADDLDPGEHDTSTLGSKTLATIERTGKNAYTLQLGGDGQPVDLNGRDLDRINTANEKSSAASRVDTGNGDVDLFVTDDNKIGLRHLGDDGTPVETRFDPKSWAKISRAMDVVIDRLDENEEFVKGDKADGVTSVTFRTNAGKARVELVGDWQGTNPGDRLEIMAVDESWGIVVDGPKQGAWGDAMQAVEDAGDNLGFYDRWMGSP